MHQWAPIFRLPRFRHVEKRFGTRILFYRRKNDALRLFLVMVILASLSSCHHQRTAYKSLSCDLNGRYCLSNTLVLQRQWLGSRLGWFRAQLLKKSAWLLHPNCDKALTAISDSYEVTWALNRCCDPQFVFEQ